VICKVVIFYAFKITLFLVLETDHKIARPQRFKKYFIVRINQYVTFRKLNDAILTFKYLNGENFNFG